MSSTMQSSLTAEKVPEGAGQPEKIQAVVRSLRTLLEDDEQEQRETFAYLKQALEEDRPSDCKLFR